MTRYLCAAMTLGLIAVAIPVRAAHRPHAGTRSRQALVWTTDDLESLHVPGLICIVGRTNQETPKSESSPAQYAQTQDPEWYAEQAAKLRDELERRNAQLAEYRQGIEDATSLKQMTGGINFEDGDIGITPEGKDSFYYNGQPVAPTLRVSPGDQLKITYVNDLPAKPTESCAITPCMDMTNLHFHGLEVSPDAPQDDVLDMMAMPGKSLSYTAQISKGPPPGIYLVHTHPHRGWARHGPAALSRPT